MTRNDFNARNVFLTYQKVNEAFAVTDSDSRRALLQDLLDFLTTSVGPFESYSMGIEDYPQEEGQHVHVLLCWANRKHVPWSRFTWRDCAPFNQSFRSRVVSAAEKKRVHDYCIKDGCYLTNFSERAVVPRNPNAWRDATNAATAEEARAIIQDNFPRDWILHHRNIDYYIQSRFPQEARAFDPVVPSSPVITPGPIENWKVKYIVDKDYVGKFFFYLELQEVRLLIRIVVINR